MEELKSMLSARKWAIERAIEMMGQGVPVKDVVEKAKEIVTYVTGEAVLPEVEAEKTKK